MHSPTNGSVHCVWRRCGAAGAMAIGEMFADGVAVTSLSCRDCAFGPDGALYVVGGGDNGTSNFASAVKWDPRSGKWHAVASMAIRRHYFAGAFAPDGQLYVAGGFEWTGQLGSAECYDPRADRWRPLPELDAYLEFCSGAVLW